MAQGVFPSAPGAIERSDRAREITLSGNLRGISLGSFNKQFEQELEAQARGVERNEAVRIAAVTRLRPIMMTFTAVILGMMPAAP